MARSEEEQRLRAKHEKDQKMLFGSNDPNKARTARHGRRMSRKEAKIARARATEESRNRFQKWWDKVLKKLKLKREPNTTDVNLSVIRGTAKY